MRAVALIPVVLLWVSCSQGGFEVAEEAEDSCGVRLISVSFGCERVYVESSCESLSNVVIELANGETERFDNLGSTLSADLLRPGVTGADVEVARDGAAHKEHFDAPEGLCPPS